MSANRVLGAVSILLGALVAASAILGPLWLNVIRQRVSDNMENQVIGADAVSLVLVAPLAVVAGVLWWREHRLAPLVALGPAVYAVYIFFQYMIGGAEYQRYEGNSEAYFPLFYGVVLLGLVVAIAAWRSIDNDALPMPERRTRRATAGVLIALGAFLGLAWARWVYDIAQGARPEEYAELPALSWLVKSMDLSFVVPASLAAGIGLLLRHRAAVKLAYGLTAAYALLAASVGSMALVMTINDDPSAQPAFAIVLYAGAVALAGLTVALWRSLPLDRTVSRAAREHPWQPIRGSRERAL